MSNHFIQFQSTVNQSNLINLHKIIMIFSVSSDGIQWTLDSGPNFVTIAVNDLDQNITISSQEILLAAWQLLLSQRQEFLANHLPRVPITPNQQETFEMRGEVLSSVGAQDLDTSSYQLTDDTLSRRHRVQLGKLTVGFSVQTRHRHPLFSNYI